MSAVIATTCLPEDATDKTIAASIAALVALAEAGRALLEERRADRLAREAVDGRKSYGVRQAAELSGDSLRAIAEWCQKGVIKAEKHGTRWRITAAELERFLSKSRRRGGLRAVETA